MPPYHHYHNHHNQNHPSDHHLCYPSNTSTSNAAIFTVRGVQIVQRVIQQATLALTGMA